MDERRAFDVKNALPTPQRGGPRHVGNCLRVTRSVSVTNSAVFLIGFIALALAPHLPWSGVFMSSASATGTAWEAARDSATPTAEREGEHITFMSGVPHREYDFPEGREKEEEHDFQRVLREGAPLRRLVGVSEEEDEEEHDPEHAFNPSAPLMAFRVRREKPSEPCSSEHSLPGEEKIREIVEDLLLRGLGRGGLHTIMLDDCWALPERDDRGMLQVNHQRFPDGLAALSLHLHSKGFVLSVPLAAHENAQECPSRLPSIQGHEAKDMKQLDDWGVSHLTVKHCGVDEANFHATLTHINETLTPRMHRPFGVYCACPHPKVDSSGAANFDHDFWQGLNEHCDSWSLPDDPKHTTEWQKLVAKDALFEHDHRFELGNDERKRFDMGTLYLDSPELTAYEMRTAVALRIVTGGPVILEGHAEAAKWRSDVIDTLTAQVVSMAAGDGDDPSAEPKELGVSGLQLWQRATANHQIISALVNLTDKAESYSIHWQDFYSGFSEALEAVSNCSVEDVWGKKQFLDATSLADAGNTMVKVGPHDTLLIKLTPRLSVEGSTEYVGDSSGSFVKRKMTREVFRDENGEITGSLTFGDTSVIQPHDEEETPSILLPFRDGEHGFLNGPLAPHNPPSFTAKPHSLRGVSLFGGLPAGPPPFSVGPPRGPQGLLTILGLKPVAPPSHISHANTEAQSGFMNPFMAVFPKLLKMATKTVVEEEKVIEKEIEKEEEAERNPRNTKETSHHESSVPRRGGPQSTPKVAVASHPNPSASGLHLASNELGDHTGDKSSSHHESGSTIHHYLRTAAFFLIIGMIIVVLVTFSRNILSVTNLFSRKADRAFQLEVVTDRPHSS